jgi:hypothetical protein
MKLDHYCVAAHADTTRGDAPVPDVEMFCDNCGRQVGHGLETLDLSELLLRAAMHEQECAGGEGRPEAVALA